MGPTHAFKREQKPLKLYSISKILSMMESVKLQLLVSNYFNELEIQECVLFCMGNLPLFFIFLI